MVVMIISWEQIEALSDSEISYLLYLEGKNIKTICKIRNLDKGDVERQIIECKIKYRILEGSERAEDVVSRLMKCRREERANAISYLDESKLMEIEEYSIKHLFNSKRDECIFYIWLLGELKSKKGLPSIISFLRCSDGNIRRMCCSALGKIGDIKCEDGLIKCINDSRPQVREYAIKSLSKIKSRKSLEFLQNVINNTSEKDYVKRAAENAIKEIREMEE
jgi:HEAT repeat protein